MNQTIGLLIACIASVVVVAGCGDNAGRQADELLESIPCENFQHDYDIGIRLLGREASIKHLINITVATSPGYLENPPSRKVVIRALEKCGILREGEDYK